MGGGMRGPRGAGGRPGQGGRNMEMSGVAERMEIRFDGPAMTVQQPMRFGEQEQILQFHYTTDGKKVENPGFGGRKVESKTQWKKNHLVTTSKSEGPMGPVQTTEDRSLSEDGKTMTIELTTRSAQMDWKRKLVYERETAATP